MPVNMRPPPPPPEVSLKQLKANGEDQRGREEEGNERDGVWMKYLSPSIRRCWSTRALSCDKQCAPHPISSKASNPRVASVGVARCTAFQSPHPPLPTATPACRTNSELQAGFLPGGGLWPTPSEPLSSHPSVSHLDTMTPEMYSGGIKEAQGHPAGGRVGLRSQNFVLSG